MKTCPSCKRTYSDHILFCPSDGTKLEKKVHQSSPGVFPGQILKDKYEIKEAINTEGKWFVYKGSEISTAREVAIKISCQPVNKGFKVLEKSLKEAQKISHPGWVKTLDFGQNKDNFAFIISEYIEGESLCKIMKDVPKVSTKLCYSIIKQTLDIIEVTHQKGILHQGLQPSKILLVKNGDSSSFVKVVGLGESNYTKEYDTNIQGDEIAAPRQGNNYTAPEVFFAKALNGTCDVYSLGVIFYELITRVLPFPSGILIHQKSNSRFPEAPPMRKVRPGLKISKKLERAIIKAIQWNPLKRHKSATTFLKTVEASEKSHIIPFIIFTTIFSTGIIMFLRPHFFNYLDRNHHYVKIDVDESESKNKTEEKKEQLSEKEVFKNKLEYVLQHRKEQENYPNMVEISAGDVSIGNEQGFYDEKPIKKHYTKAFFIDDHEVTNAEYNIFLEDMGFDSPKHWNGVYPEKLANFPVVGVSWYDAALYASWAGKRLPTEIEWEKAARFPEKVAHTSVKWSWGNDFDKKRANIGQKLLSLDRTSLRKTSTNIFDMSGNVWEWTDSWYDSETKKDKVIRGGSFECKERHTTISYREGFFLDFSRNDIGFRCVKDKE
ncbi:SUMF1/EgtB/PvdO family nonheme iron enzyme [Candidatus Uabimicrobium sp. HlEnr_7]|uniref:SUMF1/EgtB/PvdO family nonheme iron enzyme n=1 Tax=Candidatus Uabimicrobium helgolandensis TaxID=3095367 RepID=UPI0035583C32